MERPGTSPTRALALRSALFGVLVLLAWLPGSQTPPQPGSTADLAAPVAFRTDVPADGLRPSNESVRPLSQTALRRRARSRTRHDEVLKAPRWEWISRGFAAEGGGGTSAEALHVLRTRATLALAWGTFDRDARSGILHAHSSSCPPPVPA